MYGGEQTFKQTLQTLQTLQPYHHHITHAGSSLSPTGPTGLAVAEVGLAFAPPVARVEAPTLLA